MVEWISAHDAQKLDLRSSPPGDKIVELASIGLIKARAKVVQGGSYEADNGHVYLHADFWKAVLPLTGSKYRAWEIGKFEAHFDRIIRGNIRDGYSTVTAYAVEFDRDGLAAAFGVSALPTPLANRPMPVAPVTENADKSSGGRPGDKHGEPIAVVTIKLMNISDAELQSYTGDALGFELAAAYKAIGASAPAGKNLEGIAWGILRAVRAARIARV